MEGIKEVIELFLHVDKHLAEIIAVYQTWTYALLFLIIFCETGLVVTPFLPGDSLLFAAGALTASTGELNIWVLFVLLFIAAVIGDTVNYWIGHWVGPRAFSGSVRFLKKEHLERTHAFYEKHGGKAIVLARFVPIVRTFAPFVAGVGAMDYKQFIFYNVAGGFIWVSLFTFAGYFFGNIQFVQDNFSLVVIAIILLSVVPVAVEFVKGRMSARKLSAQKPASEEQPSQIG